MGNKKSGDRTRGAKRKPRQNAGRPPQSVKLKHGQQIGFWEHGASGNYADRIATVQIVKRGTFRLVRDNGEIITIITN